MIPTSPSTSTATKFNRFVVLTLLAWPAASFVARAEEAAAASPDTAHSSPEVTVVAKAEPPPAVNPPIAHPAALNGATVDTPTAVVKALIAAAPGATATVPAALPLAARPFTPVPAATVSAKEAQGLVNLGASLSDRGDYEAAEIAYRQVLNGNAPLELTKSALLGLAHMHRKQGYLTKAAAIYERYLKDYSTDDRVPDALLELGRTLRDMGAPRLAIACFYNVINSTLKLPANTGFEHYQLLAKTAQFEVAETHFQSGDFVEANKFFSRLRMLDLAPADRARAHFKSAYSLQLAGDFDAAVVSLRGFLEQWPDDANVPEARYLLSTTLRTLKRPQEALAATMELLTVEQTRTSHNPKLWSYWQRRTGNQLANDFFQSGDIPNALVIYQALVALSDDTNWRTPVTYQVALCYERLGDIERASQTYRAIAVAVAAASTPSTEIADIARMADSRLSHLAWRETTDRQVAALFDSTTGRPDPAAPAKTTSPSHDANRSPATTPSTL